RFLKQILFLEAHPEIGVVGSAASLVEGSSSWGSLLPSKKPSFKDWIFKRSVVHASILFRKSLLNEKTQYHENLDFGEDYHFLLQIYFQGARFENLEEELYIYKISKADLKQRAFKNFRKLLRMEGELSRLFPLWSRPFYLGLNSLKLVLSFAKGFVSFMKERQ
ncbi:MAG: hypothetical protein GW917_01380, partial [Bdellovibrionales bacterium]|nr:hypothetical protein [Bdellovibrionales bacterium]